MSNISPAQFIQSLEGVENTSAHSEQIEQWAREGRAALVYEVARDLDAVGASTRISKWAYQSVFQNLLRTLALTPQTDFIRYASRLAVTMPPLPSERGLLVEAAANARCRGVAEEVAASAPPEILEKVFAEFRDDPAFTEYLAVLLREMVLRGKVRSTAEILADFQNRLRKQEHPLSQLPLHLLDMERGLPRYMPQYGVRSSSWAMPFGPDDTIEANVSETVTYAEDAFCTADKTTASEAARIASAIENWVSGSNGIFEARIFSVHPAVMASQLDVSLLLRCDLECLKNANVSNTTLSHVSVDTVMEQLFAAAAYGGAYNHGLGGAYGSLLAWESLAALSGCPSHDMETIASHAPKCRGWWTFQSDTKWFHRIAWDIGIVVVQAQGTTLAILAATDTD